MRRITTNQGKPQKQKIPKINLKAAIPKLRT